MDHSIRYNNGDELAENASQERMRKCSSEEGTYHRCKHLIIPSVHQVLIHADGLVDVHGVVVM